MTDLALNAPGRGWLDRTTGFFDGMARWSAVGLLLGVPILMAIKAVCDRVVDLKPVGELLGD